MTRFGPLVSPEWLREHLGDKDVRIIDFRWYLTGQQGRDAYLRGHIPGAVFVDLDAVTGTGPGRHPLPTKQQFQEEMRRAGVSAGTKVVVYDDAGGSTAARLWFLLGWFGHKAQAVLDAGLVLDARVGERYRGEYEPIDPKPGHIPGAVSAPWIENLDSEARFKSREELRRRFLELGVDEAEGAVVYCGSGVNACHDLLALELAGLSNVRLYAGSWSDWSNRDAPVATGPDPGKKP